MDNDSKRIRFICSNDTGESIIVEKLSNVVRQIQLICNKKLLFVVTTLQNFYQKPPFNIFFVS